MIIQIENRYKLPIGIIAYPFEMGLMGIRDSHNQYKVFDKLLFFLSVIKYGIEYKKSDFKDVQVNGNLIIS